LIFKFKVVSYDLKDTEEYARKIGAYLWSSDDRLILICKRNYHKQLKNFIKKHVGN
jgi:hypothetical protein